MRGNGGKRLLFFGREKKGAASPFYKGDGYAGYSGFGININGVSSPPKKP
jgi:hypothetical protein